MPTASLSLSTAWASPRPSPPILTAVLLVAVFIITPPGTGRSWRQSTRHWAFRRPYRQTLRQEFLCWRPRPSCRRIIISHSGGGSVLGSATRDRNSVGLIGWIIAG